MTTPAATMRWAVGRSRHYTLGPSSVSNANKTCPWCSAPVRSQTELCNSCMRSPAQHPSRHGKVSAGLDLDLDFEAEAPAPASAPAKARASVRPSPTERPVASARAQRLFALDAPVDAARPSGDTPGERGAAKHSQGRRSRSGVRRTTPSAPRRAVDLALELDLPAPEGSVPPSRASDGRTTAARTSLAPATARSGATPSLGGQRDAPPDSAADEDGEALRIDLDIGPDFGPESRAPISRLDTYAPPSAGPSSATVGSSGFVSDRDAYQESLEISPEEIAKRAGYGPPPGNLVSCVPYAVRVYRQRKRLEAELARQQQLHDEVDRTLREQLSAIVEELRTRADGALDGSMAPVQAAQAALDEETVKFKAADVRLAEELSGIDRELKACFEQRKQLGRDYRLAQVRVEDANHKLLRQQRDRARVAEKLEAAHDEARRAAGKDAEYATPEHAKHIAVLQQRANALASSQQQRSDAAEESRKQARKRRVALDRCDTKIDAVQKQRATIEQRSDPSHNAHMAAFRDAQQRLLDAYEVVLERLVKHHPRSLEEAQVARLNEIQQQRVRNDRAFETLRLALDSYDEPSYKRGLTIALVAAVVLLLLLLSGMRVG